MKKAIFGLFIVGFILAGCGSSASNAPAAGTDDKGAVATAPAAAAGEVLKSRAPKADEIGKEVVCPVMKTKFVVSKMTQVFDYKGKAYFMCCGGCPGPFSKNPEKYTK